MLFLIKFAQAHETFRIPEIKALAILENVELEVVDYSEEVSRRRNKALNNQAKKITVPAMHSKTAIPRGSGKPDPKIHNRPVNS